MADSNCCQCLKEILDDNYTRCCYCKLRIHPSCLNLTPAEANVINKLKSNNVKIVCNRCDVVISSAKRIETLVESLKTSVEERMIKMEELLSANFLKPHDREIMLNESVERSWKAANVILTNVPENAKIPDVTLANDILEAIDPNAVVSPDDVKRLGKVENGRSRLLQLSFKKVETAKLVLRKRDVLKNHHEFRGIGVREDRTKQQIAYMNCLREELNNRRSQGESGITIKYKNNVPHITQVSVITSQNNDSRLN